MLINNNKLDIIVTGGNGFVGSAVRELLTDYNIIWAKSKDIDLRDPYDVDILFNRPVHTVIHCASKVAGLGGHAGKHSSFLNDNILINTNVVKKCIEKNCRLIALSSVAAFPGNCPLLDENKIDDDHVHPGERGYAISKRLLDTQIQLARQEYNAKFCCLFPCNVYGPKDSFNLETAHVIPSLIHKFYLAKKENKPVEIWGDGLSIREFIYVEDLAKIIAHLVPLKYLPDRLIVANSPSYSISQVVDLLKEIADYDNVVYLNKNNGLRVRESVISKLKFYYTDELTPLENGLTETWKWFNEHYNEARTN